MDKKHVAVIVGGACAGSEVAYQFTNMGIEVVVIEQNPLPYGKIEDGLPRWHTKLQAKEEGKIDEKLSHSLVHFLPKHRLGSDFSLEDLQNMGFSVIVLANGAWRDRPLRAEGIDEITDLSFCYQNPFIYWFNHYHEKSYQSVTYPVGEGAVIIGGGLASIDVVKVCQLETACARLKEMGIETDIYALEHKGITKFLEGHNLQYEDLKVKPAKLYYRRRVIDMPLADTPEDCTPEKEAKVQKVRQKILENAQKKYCFEMHPLRLPKRLHHQNGKICGVTFLKTQYEGDKLVTTQEEEFVETPFVVSSIGSIPELLPGLPTSGETYDVLDTVTGSIRGMQGVYGIGNSVTGKGNIQVSYKHARYMGKFLVDSLSVVEDSAVETSLKEQSPEIQETMKHIFRYLHERPGVSTENYEKIQNYVRQHQEKLGYDDYNSWREKILAER